jgi:hypothetical protein
MSPTLPPDLRAAVLERARSTPSPDAAATRRSAVIATVAGAAAGVATVFGLGVGLGGRPMPFVALSAAGWAAIAVGVSLVAAARGRMMLGRPRSLLAFVALACAPAVFAWVMGCTIGWPAVRDAQGTWATHVGCFVWTSILALGPVVALSLSRRASDPVHPRATGAAIGAAAGAWGGVLIDLHCPLTGPLHVALGHVLPVLLYAGLGALVGGRLFGVRARRER